MSPLLERALGSLVRTFLAFVFGYIVHKGWWSPEDAQLYIAGLTGVILVAGWSLWQKYKDRLKFLGAKFTPAGAPGAVIEAKAATPEVKAMAFKANTDVAPGQPPAAIVLLACALSLGAVVGVAGCAGKNAPQVAPEAQGAYTALQVVKAVNSVSEGAIAAHKIGQLSTEATAQVLTVNKQVLDVVAENPVGFKARALAVVRNARQALPPALAQLVTTYLDKTVKVLEDFKE